MDTDLSFSFLSSQTTMKCLFCNQSLQDKYHALLQRQDKTQVRCCTRCFDGTRQDKNYRLLYFVDYYGNPDYDTDDTDDDEDDN